MADTFSLGHPPAASSAFIPQLGLLLKSVLDARKRLMLTFNVPNKGEEKGSLLRRLHVTMCVGLPPQMPYTVLRCALCIIMQHLTFPRYFYTHFYVILITDVLDCMLRFLPAMNAPTVSTLYGDAGFAVQVRIDEVERSTYTHQYTSPHACSRGVFIHLSMGQLIFLLSSHCSPLLLFAPRLLPKPPPCPPSSPRSRRTGALTSSSPASACWWPRLRI